MTLELRTSAKIYSKYSSVYMKYDRSRGRILTKVNVNKCKYKELQSEKLICFVTVTVYHLFKPLFIL